MAYTREPDSEFEALSYPELHFRETIGDIYAAFFIHWIRIARFAVLPFCFSVLVYLVGDIYLATTTLTFPKFYLVTTLVQGVEVILFYAFSLSIFRLMLIGGLEALPYISREWLRRFLHYALRSLMVFIPVMLIGIVAAFGLRYLMLVDPQFIYPGIGVTALVMFWLFIRFSFALAAASVDAPYSISDSWQATSGVAFKLLIIGLISVLPIVLLSAIVVVAISLQEQPILLIGDDDLSYELTWSYWLTLPITILLGYIQASFVVILVAVSFYIRTGWRPGAVRMDYQD